MKKRNPWPLVAAMAVAVVALLAVLLLRDDDAVDVESLLAGAPAAVDEQGSASLSMVVDVDSGELDVRVDGTGAVDFASGAGSFDVELLGQRIEMLTDGSTLFVRRDGDEQWLAVHAEDAGALGSFGTGPSEAIAFIDLLRGDPGEVEDLGEQDVAGVPTRHLRVAIDLETAIARADERSRESLEALADLVPEGEDLPFEVWVDDRNLPVQQRLRGTLQGIDLVITVNLTGWGEPLGAQIPPEGEIRDVEPAELAQLFGGPSPP